MTPIVSRERILAAYWQARKHTFHEEACIIVAELLCLPFEAIQEAVSNQQAQPCQQS